VVFASAAATLVIALGSYRFIERPVLAWAHRSAFAVPS
jgi:peptidoglycan/LPS O-acetylase OafA/YrhL